jgi:hypothetical protein
MVASVMRPFEFRDPLEGLLSQCRGVTRDLVFAFPLEVPAPLVNGLHQLAQVLDGLDVAARIDAILGWGHCSSPEQKAVQTF